MEEFRRADIKLVLSRDSVVRRARAESAIVREVLRERDLGRTYDRIKRLLCVFERMYHQDHAVKYRVNPLLRRLAKTCLQQGRFLLFLRVWREQANLDPKRVMNLVEYDISGPETELQLEHYAITWFATEALKAFGENGQVAADFALALLEQTHECLEFVHRTYEQQGLTPYQLPSLDVFEHPLIEAMGDIQMFLRGAFEGPPDNNNFPGKAWLERLYERCDEPAIAVILNSIAAVSRTGSMSDARTTIGFMKESAVVDYAETTFLERVIGIDKHAEMLREQLLREGFLQAPMLLLSERIMPVAERFMQREKERITADIESGEKQLNSFLTNIESFGDRGGKMEDDIHRHARRGLRPKGLDHVEIRVTALTNAGIVGFIFHPEGTQFPNVGIEIVFKKETPHLLTYKTTMDGLADIPWEALYANERHFGSERLLHAMFIYMAYDALHRIVTERRPLREHPSRKGGSGGTGQGSVRPYMRMLPVGHRISNEALEAAQRDMGYHPPHGMTFVQAFFRNNELAYDMPSEPFAIYTDEDLHMEID